MADDTPAVPDEQFAVQDPSAFNLRKIDNHCLRTSRGGEIRGWEFLRRPLVLPPSPQREENLGFRHNFPMEAMRESTTYRDFRSLCSFSILSCIMPNIKAVRSYFEGISCSLPQINLILCSRSANQHSQRNSDQRCHIHGFDSAAKG